MAGQMVNGGYDYLDINGGTWVRTWATMTSFVLIGLLLALWLVARRPSTQADP